MKDITSMAQETGRQSGSAPQQGSETLSWSGERATPPGAGRDESPLTNFIGGSPTGVFVRLILISLIVGAFLMWLDIRPVDILRGIRRMIDGVLHLGVDAIEVIFQYVLAGAAIVVPIWLVMRLMNYGGGKR